MNLETTDIVVSLARYKELLEAEAKLEALEVFGVDNWAWYDEAMASISKEPT